MQSHEELLLKKKDFLQTNFFSIWDLKPFHKLFHVPFVQYFHTLTWDDGNFQILIKIMFAFKAVKVKSFLHFGIAIAAKRQCHATAGSLVAATICPSFSAVKI